MASYTVNVNLVEQYKRRFLELREPIFERYEFLGFISSGTYGRVYKAKLKQRIGVNDRIEEDRFFAIKKFKVDKDGEEFRNSGLSQSAIREINLCSELNHPNLITLKEVVLEDRSIYMVFDYAEYDFQQILHHVVYTERSCVPEKMLKSMLWQLINGVNYLHENWVMHRDLKPANVLVDSNGLVKVGDLGLARSFFRPIQPLYNSDKVVVTVWYRAPELILGARHYTKAIDMWSVGCIFGEFLINKPMFKGEELRMEKRTIPFQKHQMQKIVEILGLPTPDIWPDLPLMPDYHHLKSLKKHYNQLRSVFNSSPHQINSENAFDLLSKLLIYDPMKRITAKEALDHPYFKEEPLPTANIFQGQKVVIPARKLQQDPKTMAKLHDGEKLNVINQQNSLNLKKIHPKSKKQKLA